MKKKSASRSAFFNLRVLVGLFAVLIGVLLALAGLGTFSGITANSAQAQQKYKIINIQGLPPGFDCSRIYELGIDKMENLRAGLIMIACGEAEGGSPSPAGVFSQFVQNLLPASLEYGTADVDVITGADTLAHVTQSETFTAVNPDNPNEIFVAYNDSRGRVPAPINISGASISTDGGTTFTRITAARRQSPFVGTVGDPVALYRKPTRTWFTVWLDTGCGGQGLGGYKSSTPANAGQLDAFLRSQRLPATIANLVGLTTTLPLHSTDACMFPGATTAALSSSSAARLTTASPGPRRYRLPPPAPSSQRADHR